MKWIGQHIWDYYTRFRNDVYLEDLSTTTETNMLIADSDGKVSKRAMSSLTPGTVTVTDSSANTHFPVVFHDESNGLLDDTGAFTYNPNNGHMQITSGSLSAIGVDSSGDNTIGGMLYLTNKKSGSAGDDNDNCGKVTFQGRNDAGSPELITYGSIVSQIADATDGQEAGKLSLWVAEYDGALTTGLLLDGDTNANGEIDVTIGAGAASDTTIAGNLTVTSDLTVSGTTTTINTTNLNVEDKNITLNYNASSDTSGTADGSGITIQDAVDASNDATFLWVAASDIWNLSHPMQITSAVGHGRPGFDIQHAQVDRNALSISASNTTADILNIDGGALTTASFTKLTNSNSLTNYNNLDGIFGDWDFTKTGNAGDGETYRTIGLNLNITDSASSNHVNSTIDFTGMLLAVGSANTNGGNSNTGLRLEVTDATTNLGIKSSVTDGGAFFQDYSTANSADYSTWTTTTNGATTIATVDGDAHAADLTFNVDGFTKFTSPDTTGGGVEIENASASGAAALLIDNNDVDTNALLIEAANTTEHILDIEAGALTTHDAIHVKADALTTGAAINLDINDSLTTSATKSLLKIDYDKSGVTASGQTSMTAGLDINMADAATNHASSVVRNFGAVITLDAASNQGDIQQTGLGVYLTDADTANSTGIYSSVEDGGVDFKAVSSASSSDYFTIATGEDGETTFTTVENGGGSTAHMNFKPDGQFISWIGDADPGRRFNVQIDGVAAPLCFIEGEDGNASAFVLNEEGGATSDDYFRISVATNGETSIMTHDDAGANASLSFSVDGLTTFTSYGVKVANSSATGQPALLIDNNDVDQIALSIDAENTTANVINVDAGPLTTGKALYIDSNSFTDGTLIHVDIDDANTGNSQTTLMKIDWDKSGVTGGGNTNDTIGLSIDLQDSATNSGNVDMRGMYINIDADSTGGNIFGKGIDLNVFADGVGELSASGGIDTYGIRTTVMDGGTDILCRSHADTGDYFSIATTTHGATTFTTVDDDATAADLTFNIDGDIILDPHTGEDIFFKENGTERFQFHLDSTPTMEVTGNFDIDCSGDIEINADGGDITFKDDSDTLVSISAAGIVGNRKFTVTSSTHFEYQGDVIYMGGGSTTQGDLCYLKENGEWGQADADGAATGDDADRDATGMLAIALGTDPDVDGMFIRGMITMDYDLGDLANPIYISTTAGAMTQTAPSASGDFVRVVGYCLDDTNGQMYFNPDNTWVEIS